MAEMQIRGTQVKDGVIHPNGSVDFAADQSMASHRLTDLVDPSSAQDAATKAYVDTAVSTAFSAASVAAYVSLGVL